MSILSFQIQDGVCISHTVTEAAKLGVNVFLTIIYSDLETAIHNLVTTVWPGCEVKASYAFCAACAYWSLSTLILSDSRPIINLTFYSNGLCQICYCLWSKVVAVSRPEHLWAFDIQKKRASWYILIIKDNNLILVKKSTRFGHTYCPSSRVLILRSQYDKYQLLWIQY